jgi:adenylate kinase family enzyme
LSREVAVESHIVRRVSVVGNSGSGKTTVARALAARLGVAHVELDAIFHQPSWTPLPTDEFRQHVADAISGDGWVVDGNYSAVRDLIWARADTVVWLDLPRRVVMRRVAARTLRRMVSGEELWNTNRERWRTVFDADSSIIVWAWTQHDKYRRRYATAAKAPEFGHLVFIRLGSTADVERFLRSV